MDITDSSLNQSEVDRLEGHRKLEALGLNIPLRKTKRLAKIDKKLKQKKESDSKNKSIQNKENEKSVGNFIEDNNDKFQYLDEGNSSHVKVKDNSEIIPEPFTEMSHAEKSKYVKTHFNESGPIGQIDVKLFFELVDVEINLEYLDTISELVELDKAPKKEKLFFEQKMIVALSMIDYNNL